MQLVGDLIVWDEYLHLETQSLLGLKDQDESTMTVHEAIGKLLDYTPKSTKTFEAGLTPIPPG